MRSIQKAEDGVRIRGSVFMIFSIAAILGTIGAWSYWAEIDQVTRGEGRLIPPSKTQIVQSLEGGIVTEISVQVGDKVTAGQHLFTIDDTQFQSVLGESQVRQVALQAKLLRLSAEIDGSAPVFPSEMTEAYQAIVDSERAVLQARRTEFDANTGVFETILQQREAEIAELTQKIRQLTVAISLTQEQLDLISPLIERGIRPELERIQLRAEMNEHTGQRATVQEGLRRARAALEEARFQLAEEKASFIRRAREETADATGELNQIAELMVADEDRIKRTTLTSPVAGTVNNLLVTTVGQVAQSGEPLVEIIPDEEILLVEADIRPADIAFLRPGLEAKIRLTAYDFADYGALSGRIETIGADTVENRDGLRFYKVLVRTDDVLKDQDGTPLQTIPGMVATVDILIGKQRVSDYFLKPVLRLSQTAIREP